MIVLSSTQKVQVILAGAKTSLDAIFVAHYEDIPISSSPSNRDAGNLGNVVGTTNGSTLADVVPAPPTGFVRRVKSIHFNNADTGSITPSFTFIDSVGTVSKVFFKVTRATLEQLTYEDGAGWQCFSVAGARQ